VVCERENQVQPEAGERVSYAELSRQAAVADAEPANELAKRIMDIADWRKKIDEIDRKLVQLVNERAHAAREIGRLKRGRSLAIYEPEREREILEKLSQLNQGPLSDGALIQVYERLMDVMRALQQSDLDGARSAAAHPSGKSAGRNPKGHS
jgi:chorismate mutase